MDLTPEKFFRLILLARNIRDILKLGKNIKINILDKLVSYHSHPYENNYFDSNNLKNEAIFYYDMLENIKNYNFNNFSNKQFRLFHTYILIKSLFNKLIVQQLEQYGFSQFEYITKNEIREMSEKSYRNRFLQLQSVYKKQLIHLEGRFAPKDNFLKLKKLIDSIINQFENFYYENKEYNLKLVTHFIKFPDNRNNNRKYSYRHYELRIKL